MTDFLISFSRNDQRQADELRTIKITRHYTCYAEGSVLIECGNTKVICTASIEEKIPDFLKIANSNQGWLTAQYSMLPRATGTRNQREVINGKQSGRTQEIQRLIGRALRMGFDLKALGPRTITLDCDVIQADGGTRTASITGAFIAAYDAVNGLFQRGLIKQLPIKEYIAAVSVGVVDGYPLLDLNYQEDTRCDLDMNIVMTETGAFIELQGSAEKAPLAPAQLPALIALAQRGISELIQYQKQALAVSE